MSSLSIAPKGQVSVYKPQTDLPANGKYSFRSPAISAKVRFIALGLFAMYALANVPKAEAGFGFFTVCMAACMGATGGFGTMACAAACSASLAPVIP